ncbi:MAG: hypothetical protein E6G53_16145, partial [Actinobacteria bacterium]
MLEASQRWRVRILRDLEDESRCVRKRPPFRVSFYGPGAAERKDAFVRRWNPESHVLEIEAKDAGAGTPSVEEDQWLRDRRQARHAIVVCNQEIESIRLTLGISSTLGGDLEVTRVATQRQTVLDEMLRVRTAREDMATATIRDIAELGSNTHKMSLDARQRLVETLKKDLEKKGLDDSIALERATELFARPRLRLHSDSTWRARPAEQPLLKALVAPVPVSVLVRARLAVDLATPENLREAAERLSGEGEGLAAFVGWCEYIRHLAAQRSRDEMQSGLERDPGDETGAELLRLARVALPAARAARNGDPGARLTGGSRVVVFAGDPDELSPMTSAALEPLLKEALEGYEGAVYSRKGRNGARSIVAEVADELRVTTKEYPSGDGHGVDACLRIWDDLVKEGIDAEEVPVIACPGEDHPTA